MQSLGMVMVLLLSLAPATWAATYADADGSVAVDPSRGVDRKVDYESLVRLGPWDDRNYRLTRDDLAFLGENEADLRSPLPAFFRVEIRREVARLGGEETVAYPLSALNVFRQRFGGYSIAGKYYRKAVWRDGRYFVLLDSEAEESAAENGADAPSEVRITSPNGAAESAIAISPVDTQKLVAGTNGPNGGQRMHYSQDGGATWTQVDLPLGGTCCDPTVEWSTDGQYAYAAALGGCFIGCELWFYRSDDGGVTWTSLETETPGDPRREIETSFADREFLHVDQYPTSPYKDNIYLMWHRWNIMRMSRSTDFGNTWSTYVFEGTPLGIGGDIATDRSGNVYYAWPGTSTQEVYVSRSSDGGVTFGPLITVSATNASSSFPIPAMESREAAMYVAADADTGDGTFADSVYLVWTDGTGPESTVPAENHARLQVAYSRDGGETWTVTTPHETVDELTVDRWQPFIAVGQDGTVHVIFNDTRRSGDRMSADVFYAYSTDGAQTWSAPQRVTSEMSPNIQDGFEFGDYSGLDIVMNDLVAVFTDNRHESGGTGDSVDVYAAGIVPGGGPGGTGRIPGARGVPGDPLILTRLEGGDLQLAWSQVCGSGSDYAVYEGVIGVFDDSSPVQCSTGGATSTTFTPSDGDRFYVVVATSDGSSEGSYGRQSDDSERPPSSSACFAQNIGACP